MNVSCPDCHSVFRVDPAKVPAGGVRARCSVCGGVMPVDAPHGARALATAAAASPSAPSAAMYGSHATPGMFTAPAIGTSGASATVAPTAAVPTPAMATPVMSTPVMPAPAMPTPAMPTPAMPAPAMQTPAMNAASPSPLVAPAMSPSPPVTVPTAAQPTPSAAPRPPINPFLSNDPGQKARRLARALVSDMVTYHPTLRDQALREGTIKQLFKEEIKKSYEEYVEQVGHEFAESTSHFQDALNDILAGGRQVF